MFPNPYYNAGLRPKKPTRLSIDEDVTARDVSESGCFERLLTSILDEPTHAFTMTIYPFREDSLIAWVSHSLGLYKSRLQLSKSQETWIRMRLVRGRERDDSE